VCSGGLDGKGLVQAGQSSKDLHVCVGAVDMYGGQCTVFQVDGNLTKASDFHKGSDGFMRIDVNAYGVSPVPLNIVAQFGDMPVESAICRSIIVSGIHG